MRSRRNRPPRLADKILSWFCDPDLHEAIQGDLHEYYNDAKSNSWKTKFRYWFQVVNLLRPFAFRDMKIFNGRFFTLLRFHLKISGKTYLKNKVLTAVNLFGLVIGIGVSFLIWAFVSHELTYDRSFPNSERVFRVIRNWQGGEKFGTSVSAPFAEALRAEFPEVITTTRLYHSENNIVMKADKVFREEYVLAADATFFEVFGTSLIHGNTSECLRSPGSVVISESAALKLFNESNPTGNNIAIESSDLGISEKNYVITGVFDDFSPNSHMAPDFLISSSSFPFMNNPNPLNHFLKTYVLLQNTEQSKQVEERLPAFMERFYGTDYFNYSRSTYLLQPLDDIHLNSIVHKASYESSKGSYFAVSFFPALAVFILIISVINFVNLHTSHSIGRKKETWVKKVNGASLFQETGYLVLDSVIIFLVALFIAICTIEFFFTDFESFVDRQIDRQFLYSSQNIVLVLSIVVALGILSGLHPAVMLVSSDMLKEKKAVTGVKKTGVFLNSKLIILQFMICMFFLAGSIFIFKQFRYLNSETNRGFNKENVLLIKNPWYLGESHAAFKQALTSNRNIISISGSESVPGINNFSTWGHPVDSADDDSHITVFYCDEQYVNTLGLKLVEGRFFSKGHKTDNLAIVLNETAVKKLGWDDPIGKRYRLDTVFHVIGVIQDIHFESLHNAIDPMGMVLIRPGTESFISIRIASDEIAKTVSFVNDVWGSFVANRPIDYTFLDKEFASWYTTDRKMGMITAVLSALAIILSCLGILGLMFYTILRRTKEIGIRKVFGASTLDIHLLFIQDTSKWLMMAFVLAIPFSVLAMKKWLQDFAYRAEISWWIFAIAGLAVYLIALACILFQSYRAAHQNPIDSLRYE